MTDFDEIAPGLSAADRAKAQAAMDDLRRRQVEGLYRKRPTIPEKADSMLPGIVVKRPAPGPAESLDVDVTVLDDAVVAYVWRHSSAVPGRHPDAVSDPALRARVEQIIAELDVIRPDADATDLTSWADGRARSLAAGHPELGEPAIGALRDLLAWIWR